MDGLIMFIMCLRSPQNSQQIQLEVNNVCSCEGFLAINWIFNAKYITFFKKKLSDL